jgi:hypothetical protein
MKVSRRSFLKSSAAAGAAVAASGGLVQNVLASAPAMTPGPGNKWPGRVAINFNKNAVTRSGTNATAVPATIAKMVDDTIKLLTGEATVGGAWKTIFPSSLTAQSKIAIKVNTLNPGLPAPHWSSVKAITDGLQKMDLGGTPFPAANITIYEAVGNHLSDAGTGYNSTNFGSTIKIANDTSNLVAGGDGALNNRTYAKTLRDANFLINVFSPRGHMTIICGSTFTLGFKSHFGTYSTPSGLHGNGETSVAATNIRDINCTGPVLNKTVLSVCSGIFGMNEGNGPSGVADDYTNYAKTIDSSATLCPTTIMMSTDPVSIEMQAVKMMRLNKSPAGEYGIANMPTYLRASGGVTVSDLAGTTYNIGQIDESKMEVRRIINDIVMVENHPDLGGAAAGANIIASPIKGHRGTFIEFRLPHDLAGHDAQIDLYDIKGALVRRHSQKVLGALNHFSWNNNDASGKQVSLGTYVVRLTSGRIHLSTKFVTMR